MSEKFLIIYFFNLLHLLCLGESTWLRLAEDYARQKKIEDYKALHGGKMPPDPFITRVGKIFLPCFYQEREFIKLGTDMENRHRSGK